MDDMVYEVGVLFGSSGGIYWVGGGGGGGNAVTGGV